MPGQLLSGLSGPAPRAQGRCRASLVTSSAQTRAAADGVLGVVTLVGRACSLHVNPGGIRLLDAADRRVPVQTPPRSPVNPAFSLRPDISEGNGSVRVGFAWTGSFCGRSPVTVQIPALPAAVRVVVHGPVPACVPGRPGYLIPGVVAGPGEAVEPAPAAWASLRARLVIPATVPEGPIPMKVVLTDIGTADVSLSAPCPSYLASLTYPTVAGRGFGGGGTALVATFGDLCTHPLVVHPGQPLTIAIPAIHYTPEGPWQVGATLSARWAIAGVPTATSNAVIR